jgi:hypothetical protein
LHQELSQHRLRTRCQLRICFHEAFSTNCQ